MDTWKPISEEKIWEFINSGELKLSGSESRFFEAIRIMPIKWQQNPWGTNGGGFWVIGIIGKLVIWYNDIEEGFNISEYSKFGEITEYNCNQDYFEEALRELKSYVDNGVQYTRVSAPISGSYIP